MSRDFPSHASRDFPNDGNRDFPLAGGGVVGEVETDPDFSSVVLLLHFEGNDEDTTTTDNSDSNHSVAFLGNAQIDVDQPKFGASSLLLDGIIDRIEMGDSADWEFSTIDWTLEGFFRWNNDIADFQLLMGQWASGQKNIAIFRDQVEGTLELFLSVDGTASIVQISASWTPSLLQHYHIAADYDGTTYRLYVDGVVLGTSTTARTLFNATTEFTIGANNASAFEFQGRVDEVRVTKGVARYAGAFTPPTAPFPDS